MTEAHGMAQPHTKSESIRSIAQHVTFIHDQELSCAEDPPIMKPTIALGPPGRQW